MTLDRYLTFDQSQVYPKLAQKSTLQLSCQSSNEQIPQMIIPAQNREKTSRKCFRKTDWDLNYIPSIPLKAHPCSPHFVASTRPTCFFSILVLSESLQARRMVSAARTFTLFRWLRDAQPWKPPHVSSSLAWMIPWSRKSLVRGFGIPTISLPCTLHCNTWKLGYTLQLPIYQGQGSSSLRVKDAFSLSSVTHHARRTWLRASRVAGEWRSHQTKSS